MYKFEIDLFDTCARRSISLLVVSDNKEEACTRAYIPYILSEYNGLALIVFMYIKCIFNFESDGIGFLSSCGTSRHKVS